jgi:phosphoribosyl 1,2-cyclic phosphodiesterase
VEVTHGDHHLVLDGGTGIRELGLAMLAEQQPHECGLLFSHTHWDHIQGLPFFGPFFDTEYHFKIFAPLQLAQRIRAILTQQMEQAVFPVPFRALESDIRFALLPEKGAQYGPFSIASFPLNHPGGAVAYRIEAGGAAVVYATDNEIDRQCELEAFRVIVEKVTGADLYIADGQYTREEYAHRRRWGHSPYEEVLAAATEAGVGRLAVTHHDPMRDDTSLRRIERAVQKKAGALDVFFARDGLAVEV